MSGRVPVAVLGATGTVGQKFVRLLADGAGGAEHRNGNAGAHQSFISQAIRSRARRT